MINVQVNGLSFWNFNMLAGERGVRHFVSQRNIAGTGEEFTLSFSSHPDRSFIEHNRKVVAEAMGIRPEQFFMPSQVHGTHTVVVQSTTPRTELQDTDALITAEKEICIGVMSADCVPILVYDPTQRVVAAVHSGWRGTVATILSKVLQQMIDQFGCRAENMLVGIGPSICQESYEVGEEVIDEVRNVFGSHNELVKPTRSGKGKLDLWEANRIQLLEAGVPPMNIEVAGLCTVQNNNLFFSARMGDKGRFAAGIMLT